MASHINHPLKNAQGVWNQEEVLEIICERIADGATRLEALGRGVVIDEKKWGLPGLNTVEQWAMSNPLVADALARARKAKAHKFADETIEIADAPPKMTTKGHVDTGAERHRQTRINARQWMAEKLNREDYGSQLNVDIHHHGTINLTSVLSEARGRVLEGEILPADSDQLPAPGVDCSDLFE